MSSPIKTELTEINIQSNSKNNQKKTKHTSGKNSENNTEEILASSEQDFLKIERDKLVTDQGDDFSYPIRIDQSKAFIWKQIGNMMAFFGDRDGNPLIMIGPHWPMFMCFSTIMSIIVFLFFSFFWRYLSLLFKFFGIILYISFILSYTYTFLINPGFPKYDLDSRIGEPRNKFRYCKKCKLWVNIDKKPNHCFECNICVEGYDHHCPWTGKCIGRRNLKSFYIFLISTLFIIVFLIIGLTNANINRRKMKKNSKY
ncbi:MAG: hypothetical protein MJ252_08375 [archaeon]|nr:hypothetical protein [archaeon]